MHAAPQCVDDTNDGSGGNETPAAATDVRPGAQVGAPLDFDSATAFASSVCSGDVDVYAFTAFAGEEVRVALIDAPSAASVATLGTEPANLNDDATALASTSPAGTPIAFDNGVTPQLFVTVRTPATTFTAGTYQLSVTTTP